MPRVWFGVRICGYTASASYISVKNYHIVQIMHKYEFGNVRVSLNNLKQWNECDGVASDHSLSELAVIQ